MDGLHVHRARSPVWRVAGMGCSALPWGEPVEASTDPEAVGRTVNPLSRMGKIHGIGLEQALQYETLIKNGAFTLKERESRHQYGVLRPMRLSEKCPAAPFCG
ncbi:predicted protein [Coccidioides posadasii str. Silveira]|uniref:Predicted protein n=1 Tax=Coccidioides posadasii (strain RMSCC 757 / Silveira) TaxID=443226 RepID=E9CR76_COCPS|nr:predicted protein [Coccidioides posadasii str. Silveira]